jgi:hypothetical protein
LVRSRYGVEQIHWGCLTKETMDCGDVVFRHNSLVRTCFKEIRESTEIRADTLVWGGLRRPRKMGRANALLPAASSHMVSFRGETHHRRARASRALQTPGGHPRPGGGFSCSWHLSSLTPQTICTYIQVINTLHTPLEVFRACNPSHFGLFTRCQGQSALTCHHPQRWMGYENEYLHGIISSGSNAKPPRQTSRGRKSSINISIPSLLSYKHYSKYTLRDRLFPAGK